MLKSLSAKVNSTKRVSIFYIGTAHFDNQTFFDQIWRLLNGTEVTLYGVDVNNYSKSSLEQFAEVDDGTCRVKSLEDWRKNFFGENSGKRTSTGTIDSA